MHFTIKSSGEYLNFFPQSFILQQFSILRVTVLSHALHGKVPSQIQFPDRLP